jgi:hypothetical protein
LKTIYGGNNEYLLYALAVISNSCGHWIWDGIGSNSEKWLIAYGLSFVLRCEDMRKSLKIAAVATMLLIAFGAVAFVYACSQNNLKASDDQQTGIQNTQNSFWWKNVTMPYHRHMPPMCTNDFQWVGRLSENATLSTVNGTVVSEVRGVLILDTGTGQIRVLLPKDWTLNEEVVDRATLFNSTFVSPGHSVTIKALESQEFSNANFSINVMLGYEAINATGTHAYAVLPFNIQPKS